MTVHPKIQEFIAFAVGSCIIVAVVSLCNRFTTPWKDPRPLLDKMTDEEKRRLARGFKQRRRAAIAALCLPLLLLLLQTVFQESARTLTAGIRGGALLLWVGTLVLFAAGIVFIVFVYRCPFCRSMPEAIMEGTGTFGYNGQSHKGLDLFPSACKNCGLDFTLR